MENTASDTAGFTGPEIVHYAMMFCYNWEKNDFKKAFANSRLGWDYYYDRLIGKIENSETNPCQAIVEIILNMDNAHRQMFFDYLFTEKYADQIMESRKWNSIISDAREKQSANTNRNKE